MGFFNFRDMRIVIDFKNREQGEVFLDWFKDSGFDELCLNDSVHDDLPSEFFYRKITLSFVTSSTDIYFLSSFSPSSLIK